MIAKWASFFVLGILTWPLAEYLIHRFLGHHAKSTARNGFTHEHLRHHREVNYFAATWKKLLVALAVLTGSFVAFYALVGPFAGLGYGLGLSGMYMFYELVHRRAHTHAPRGWYSQWVRKHHFYHHFESPKVNHGVTSPICDIIFGTYQPIEKPVRVPRRLALDWMRDEFGELPAYLSKDYVLRGGTAS